VARGVNAGSLAETAWTILIGWSPAARPDSTVAK